jgi:hypothetical protein
MVAPAKNVFLAILSRYACLSHDGLATETGREPMNATIKSVLPSFDVVKWGVPGDKLDQLAALLGLNDGEKAALKSKGDVVIMQDPKKA